MKNRTDKNGHSNEQEVVKVNAIIDRISARRRSALFKLSEGTDISKSQDPYITQLKSLVESRQIEDYVIAMVLIGAVHKRRISFTFSDNIAQELMDSIPQTKHRRRWNFNGNEYREKVIAPLLRDTLEIVREAKDGVPGIYRLKEQGYAQHIADLCKIPLEELCVTQEAEVLAWWNGQFENAEHATEQTPARIACVTPNEARSSEGLVANISKETSRKLEPEGQEPTTTKSAIEAKQTATQESLQFQSFLYNLRLSLREMNPAHIFKTLRDHLRNSEPSQPEISAIKRTVAHFSEYGMCSNLPCADCNETKNWWSKAIEGVVLASNNGCLFHLSEMPTFNKPPLCYAKAVRLIQRSLQGSEKNPRKAWDQVFETLKTYSAFYTITGEHINPIINNIDHARKKYGNAMADELLEHFNQIQTNSLPKPDTNDSPDTEKLPQDDDRLEVSMTESNEE